MKKIWIVLWTLVNFAFSGFLAPLLTDFVKKQFTGEDPVSWEWLLDNRFSLLSFVIFVIVFLIVFGLTVLVRRNIPVNKAKRQEKKIRDELKKYNSAYFQDVSVRASWEVLTEGLIDDSPSITNLQLFCMNNMHRPIRMQSGVCPCQGCPNHTRRVDVYNVKNIIESDLVLRKQSLRTHNT